MYWDVPRCIGDVLGCLGVSVDVLGCLGMSWDVLGCLGISVDVRRCPEMSEFLFLSQRDKRVTVKQCFSL